MFKNVLKGFWRIRNRHKSFSLILIICYVVIVFLISLLQQMKTNVQSFWVDSLVGGNIVSVYDDEFVDFYSPPSFEKYFNYSDFLSKQNKNRDFTPRIRLQALIENKQSLPTILCGIEAEEFSFGNHIEIEEGREFNPDANEILLTYSTASTIGVELGDDVYITLMTKDGYPSYEVMKLVGYISFGNVGALFGDNISYVPLESLRKICCCDDDEVNEVLTDVDSSLFIKGDYTFIKGKKMFSISRLVTSAILILEILILFSLGVFLFINIISNAKLILKEKNKEIVVYLTFGASPLFIGIKIFSELIIYFLYNCLIGVILSYLLIKGFNALGFYSIDVSTEMLMSSSQFIVKTDFYLFLSIILVFLALLVFGAAKTVVINIRNISLKNIDKE